MAGELRKIPPLQDISSDRVKNKEIVGGPVSGIRNSLFCLQDLFLHLRRGSSHNAVVGQSGARLISDKMRMSLI